MKKIANSSEHVSRNRKWLKAVGGYGMAGAKSALTEKLKSKFLYVCEEHMKPHSRQKRNVASDPITTRDFHAPDEDPIFMTRLEIPRPLHIQNWNAFLEFLQKQDRKGKYCDVKPLGVDVGERQAVRALRARQRTELRRAEEEAERLLKEKAARRERRRQAEIEAVQTTEADRALSHPAVEAELRRQRDELEVYIKDIEDAYAAEINGLRSKLRDAEVRVGLANYKVKSLRMKIARLERKNMELQDMLAERHTGIAKDKKMCALDFDYFSQ
jgi:hypothetical protein